MSVFYAAYEEHLKKKETQNIHYTYINNCNKRFVPYT